MKDMVLDFSAAKELRLPVSEVERIIGVAQDCGADVVRFADIEDKPGELDVQYIHKGDGRPFERIRRITGYLVGTVDRFNDAKRAEEHDRVKHSFEEETTDHIHREEQEDKR